MYGLKGAKGAIIEDTFEPLFSSSFQYHCHHLGCKQKLPRSASRAMLMAEAVLQ